MDDRGAYIDIVFRNGLKDYEVLPPSEVWDNISPAIGKRRRSFILFRVAAVVALVLSMTFAVSQLGMEIPANSTQLALNDETVFTEINPLSITKAPVIFLKDGNKSPIPLQNISPSASFGIKVNQDYSGEISSSEESSVTQVGELNIEDVTRKKVLGIRNPFIPEETSSIEFDDLNSLFLPVSDDGKTTARWSIAALASPTYYSSFSSGKDEFMNELALSEQTVISYTGGVAFSYKINKRFSIQSGLFYSSVGKEVGGVNSFGGFQKYENSKGNRNFELLTTNGTVYTNNPDVFLIADGPDNRMKVNITNDAFDPVKASLQVIDNNLLQNFSYLELPLYIRYKLIDKAVDFNLIGGVSYNMLVNNTVYANVDGGRYNIGETEGLNPITLSSSFGMGMEYSFSENLSLNLEPTFRYYLNPFNQNSASGTHPYSFGIFSGISYKF